MNSFERVFGNIKPIIGMVHLKPLPGSPLYGGNMDEIYEAALKDLNALVEGGANALIVENFGDIPYGTENELITYTAFTNIFTRLKEQCHIPMGVNIQFNDFKAEWAIAYACDADFIRIENFAEHRLGPNGVINACGPELMRLKGRFPKDICLICDVNVKHTFEIVHEPLDFIIESIIEGGGDCLICTGITTGKSPSIEDVKKMKELAEGLPVIVGSGVNEKTVNDYLEVSDGAIIGSSFKEDGKVLNPISLKRVKSLMDKIKK